MRTDKLLMDSLAAEVAQQALDTLNAGWPFGPMVPEDQQIKMDRDEMVGFGNFLVQREIERNKRNRRRRETSKMTTRHNLISAAAKRTGLPQSACTAVLNAMLDVITESVAAGDMVQLRGAMTFYSRVRKPRPARNPRTGDVVMLPWRKVMLCRWPGRRAP